MIHLIIWSTWRKLRAFQRLSSTATLALARIIIRLQLLRVNPPHLVQQEVGSRQPSLAHLVKSSARLANSLLNFYFVPDRPKSPTGSRDFSLVPNIPSPTASELGPAAVKQLMTWGTLNATPRIVTPLDDPNNGPDLNTSFHLPAISHREVISHKLSNRASKSLRAKAGLLGLTPGIGQSKTASARTGKRGDMLPPSWTPRRADAAGSLTPAARRLLDRTAMGASAARRTEAMEQSARWENAKRKDKDLNRIRWTPTPTH